jgi:hypothetical protein
VVALSGMLLVVHQFSPVTHLLQGSQYNIFLNSASVDCILVFHVAFSKHVAYGHLNSEPGLCLASMCAFIVRISYERMEPLCTIT